MWVWVSSPGRRAYSGRLSFVCNEVGHVKAAVPQVSGDHFAARRKRIVERLGDRTMVLPAGPEVLKSRDTSLRYNPGRELYYATGVTEPGAVAVLRGGDVDHPFVLFIRPRDPEAERWTGTRLGVEGALERFAPHACYPISELEERLPALLAQSEEVLFRLGGNATCQALVEGALARARVRGPRMGDGPRCVRDPGAILDELRIVKDEAELSVMRRAADVTVQAFLTAMEAVRPGVGEWELEALIDHTFRREGGAGPAYPTIVGSGENSCILHYVENARVVESGDLILIDAGAEVGLYAADVTRTLPASGTFTSEQRTIHDLVHRAEIAAIEAIRPGERIGIVHDVAREVLIEGLLDLGVLTGTHDEILEEATYKRFFPHQTSHWLGLDVHDVGDYATENTSRLLEPGMVLTVEPGLYFPAGESLGTASPFAGIGVRIEDDVLVTADGHEVLTEALPASAADLEAVL